MINADLPKVLVTGAAGFVGWALVPELLIKGYQVKALVRKSRGDLPVEAVQVVGDLTASVDGGSSAFPRNDSVGLGSSMFVGVEVVVHLAARVHVMDDTDQNPLALYRATNLDATLNLARQAADARVKRFVFISSIKVNGEGGDAAYREIDAPAPVDAYAISKWEAEQGLWRIARETGLEVVILRPPLVYGPGVKANFLRLMQLIQKGWPLPLGAIHNRRSLLYLGNLVDAIRLCVEHPAAAGQTFLLDDGEVVSTPGLIHLLARAMGRPARLLTVPVGVLELAGTLLGKRAAVGRLTGSLYVDGSAIRSRLGWAPPYSMEAGLAATVAAFLSP